MGRQSGSSLFIIILSSLTWLVQKNNYLNQITVEKISQRRNNLHAQKRRKSFSLLSGSNFTLLSKTVIEIALKRCSPNCFKSHMEKSS